ncbi:maleate cis-trans isomerase family protein [Mycobacterium marinum]|uniref:Maleate isomerase n=2 Tax=Mycobacterium marinum TaxID=1781 RepID=B2HIS0_MYCMM|nr:Asp/Glu racemase [Mycobacterium marinum]ACC41827.1 maleate cis-trans isomerase [Mycobacterium marinum M]MDC8973866.1 Asp/Glu racemase [Mycobacterium marinum]MDC8994769.1 Asp/Glu racemase [Mycobacterium marinum]MDC9004273.1 Asp/Glu racemase [Mycobacterium marinum]RFZ44533.1 Maleate isomerase [Mycobacterium marinum]
MSSYRVGLLVPSSNTTMEAEVPEVLRANGSTTGDRFTFHASRMRMKKVDPQELMAMNASAERATTELADAAVDVMAYACLVAVMAAGPNAHRTIEERLTKVASQSGGTVEVISSAGALVEGIRELGAKKIAMVAPYMKPLTSQVVDYIEAEGIEVMDVISLEVEDNRAVGRLDPMRLPHIAHRLDTHDADAVVLSACVQMPSLAAIPAAEAMLGLPVISAATATSWKILRSLGVAPVAADAGALFDGGASG